jgi:ParB/RepB/Spo0J family partition protein
MGTTVTTETTLVELAHLSANPWQPRAGLDPNHIKELADSIEQVGLLQKPLVRRAGVEGGHAVYEIAFGHYRVEALKLLGRTFAEVEVRALADEEMAIIALAENVKRKDIPPIEQYRAWQKALALSGMTIERLATTIGLDRSTVSNNLRILRLPQYVLDWVDNGDLSAHGAREFLCLMGEDGHFHEGEAQRALAAISGTGPGNPPDWRVTSIRYRITEELRHSRVGDWRPLFASTNNIGAGHGADPEFDVEEFRTQHTARVHSLPWDELRWDGNDRKVAKERSYLWTCATSAWSTAQSKAKGEAPPASESPAAPARLVRSADFAKVMAQDPVAQQVVAAAVSQETTKPKKGAAKPSVETLPDEQRAALGSRAAPVELTKGQWARLIDGPAYYYAEHTERPPSYFPDIAECKERCTIGATYARDKVGAALYLYCLNKAHYEEKVAAGREVVRAEFAAQVEAIDAEELRLAALLAPHLTGPITPWLAALLLVETNWQAVTPRGLAYNEAREFAREWASLQRLLAVLPSETPHALATHEWTERLAALDAAGQAEVAALAMGHWFRQYYSAETLPAFIAKLQEVSA